MRNFSCQKNLFTFIFINLSEKQPCISDKIAIQNRKQKITLLGNFFFDT